MEGAEAGEAAASDVPVPDWKEFGYTPVFLAKSAQVAERMGDAFCSLQRVAKSEGNEALKERFQT